MTQIGPPAEPRRDELGGLRRRLGPAPSSPPARPSFRTLPTLPEGVPAAEEPAPPDDRAGSELRRATDDLISAVHTEGTALTEVRERLERWAAEHTQRSAQMIERSLASELARLREEVEVRLAAEMEARRREETGRLEAWTAAERERIVQELAAERAAAAERLAERLKGIESEVSRLIASAIEALRTGA